MEEYVVFQWPESQELMAMPEFEEHCYLISDDKGLDDFGPSAYFVEKEWLNKINKI